jgi:signal transduction histidine kinase
MRQPKWPPQAKFAGVFRKYVGLFVAVVCAALVINGAFEVWFDYHEQRTLLVRIQRQQADAAALRISQFIREIEGQLAWATQLPWSADNLEEWRFDTVRMLRQVPAITDVTQLDSSGRAQAYMSRVSTDVIGSQADLSADPAFVEAIANKIYYGPIRFLRDSEPYMTLAMAGVRKEYGVIVAQVNLRFIWDVVSEIKVGQRGQAYVIDPQGRLIAHPDISMVLRNTDVSRLPQMRVALAAQSDAQDDQEPVVRDAQDRQVLSSYTRIAPLGWLVFVDLPVEEAYATLYASIVRSGALLIAALLLAAFAGLYLARRMVIPIQAMRVGAARIGGGDLTQRITIKTGDELEALADEFNSMAGQLQDSYASLECKVDERTHQLAAANLAKSRFIAAASHDLRQPVQALGLFVEQLHGHMKSAEGSRLVERIDAAIGAMNELFNALLDISKLDAGALSTNVIEFQIAQLLQRIESTFAEAAREKRLSFRIVPSSAWVCSDFILLERILLNLVSNAVRYTATGGVVVGCRRRGETVHIEVWDTGPGIQEDQRRNIFGEFYRLADTHGGLGLGLAIVDRLCRLLHHPIELVSTMGKGSRFSVTVPGTAAPAKFAGPQAVSAPTIDVSSGKLVVVMDDDALVLDGMGGMLRNWGCRVVAAATPGTALAAVAGGDRPHLIISDCCLANGQSGVAAIAELRRAFGASIPAFLITGDTSPERLHEAKESGHHLLHKPVRPMRLRAMLSQLLKSDPLAGTA